MVQDNNLRQGRAFCFLPLPVLTGLSVQVNGYFEISSNRRDIWYGGDMDRGGKFRSDWNRLLLEDVAAPLFNELLLGLQTKQLPTDLYYSLWPTGSFEGPWALLVKSIYKAIYSSPVLYSHVAGGTWVSPPKAIIHDKDFVRNEELGEALVLAGMPVVHLQKPIISMFSLNYKSSQFTVATPEIVRNFLKGCPALANLNKSTKLVLLEYCLNNIDGGDIAKDLMGLPLVPLANGCFGVFSCTLEAGLYFLCHELEYELLHSVSNQLIDRSIPRNLFDKLCEVVSGSQVNVMFIDAPAFIQFFSVLFPSGWELKNQVIWNPDVGPTFPTAAWFKLLWQYLGRGSYDLGLFADWPILPSTSGHLYRPLISSKLINAETLSSSLKGLLEKMGCKVLDVRYGVEHKQLSLFVHDGDAIGVIRTIFERVSSIPRNQAESLFNNVSSNERDELRQFLLDPKWYVGSSIPEVDINKCKALPIYKVYDGCYGDLLSMKRYLPPLGVSENLLNGEFIFCTSSTEQDVLTRYYGVERMHKSFFYQKNVLSRISTLQPMVRDSVMLAILEDLPQLSMEEPTLKESLKVIKFVPTMNDGLKSPQMLYDPRVEELYLLLEDSDCFPTGQFLDPGVLDMLVPLGLRTFVTMDTLIQSARQVELMMHKDQSKAHSKAQVLLSYLELHATKWISTKLSDAYNPVNKMFARVTTALRPRDLTPESELERFWGEMKMICWCPVLVNAPHPALPWPVVSTMVAPPKLVRLQSDMWIVSASSRILDGECTSSTLSQILGWSTPPSGNLIAAQLLELGKNNEIVTDSALRQELALVMPKIYSLLTSLVGSDDMEIVKAVLEGSRWIWVGDGFAKVDEVVLSGQLHMAPFIRVIPVDLAVFKELFLELGIKEYLGAMDYANILSRMAAKKGSASLDAQELRMAGLIVQHLAGFQFQDFRVQIFLPDSTSRMCPSTDLVFNDAPWLLDSGDASGITLGAKQYVHNFVHGNISNDVAEKLGVRSLRRLLLAESSDSMNLTLSGVAEAFGQHEALTTRLKHIVDMYADGPGILFELVQNAEDACSSEVVFLLDKTQYGTSSILSPEMAEWQGPALYCFNDSVFSPQDLYAISRIGQDSKLDKPFSIGRFGLGFNCVYHFTDIPGFVSGENIVIFDPHAFYLPGISPSHPGLRIKFVGRSIFEQFPDQFAPFMHFGCDLQQSFPGTLFRFPLRNETAAHRSQIKKETYTPDDVASLFSSFSQVVPEALLFLRHVKKISLYVKDGPNQQMRLIHHVSKHQSGSIKMDPMLNFVKGSRQGAMNKDQFMNKLSKTSDGDLPWSCQKMTVAEQSPASCYLHSWVISECIGGGNAKRLSMTSSNNSRNFNFIPWASLAAYLQSVKISDMQMLTGEGISDEVIMKCQEVSESLSQERRRFEGRAFCFLPLPVTTSLPVHVNAYFELSSNRRDIWMGNDMAGGGKVRSEWNMALLEDVAPLAYGRLLSAIAQEVGPSDLFVSLWPTAVKVEPWVSMTRKLYSNVADLGLQVLYTKARGGQWIPTRQSIFPDFYFSKSADLNEALTEAGLPLVSLPKSVVEKFMDACPSLHLLNPNLLRNLLIRRKRGFLTKEAAVLALEYCLSDMGGLGFLDKLNSLPLVPLANGSFTMFNKRGEGERIFFTTQIESELVIDSAPHLLIDRSLPEGILEKLQEIAKTGQSNICLFTCHSLVELLPRILPPEWQRARKVSWSPGQHGHPSVDWMRSLWRYLKLSDADLSLLSEWPILPIGDENLVQLRENSNVIRDEGWSENMHSLLQKLGCCFLRADLQIDHSQLKFVIQEASASGVLNAVKSVASNPLGIRELFANASVAELHELRSFIFQSKWFSQNQIGQLEISIIKSLPIFESYKSRELVSLISPRMWLKPEGVPDEILNENFIRTESEKENSILRTFIDIREPDKIEFYRDHVMGRISEFVPLPEILSAIFADVKILMEEDDSLKAALSEVPFVSTAGGAWAHPSRYVPIFLSIFRYNMVFCC
jgi:sacsin